MNAQAGSGGPLRILARIVLSPVRRFFDSRFAGLQDGVASHVSAEARNTRDHLVAAAREIHEVSTREQKARLEDLRRFVAASRDANIDAATFIGEALRDLDERLADVQDSMESRPAPGELDRETAELLNRAEGHAGFAAERGLWFNWPVALIYGPDEVCLDRVNERIVEVPYVFRALAPIEPGARVLDVGAAESTLALSLAAMGYQVVALDPRSYPLEHANLRAVEGPLETWETNERFDAVLCVSTLEHLGVGEYGEPRKLRGADERALERMGELLTVGGLLVLTAPLGRQGYERESLDELLQGWQVDDLTVVARRSPTEWSLAADEPSDDAVALITARRP